MCTLSYRMWRQIFILILILSGTLKSEGRKRELYIVYIATDKKQGPVVQSVVSLTSSFRVISLTVLADSVYNILIFFAEKM